MDVDYVGNPLLDAIIAFEPNPEFLKQNNISGKKIIALLPGSRKQEINYLLPDMIAVAGQFADCQFVIAGAPSFKPEFYSQFVKDTNIPVIFNATYDLLTNAHAAIVASGTATLETALFNIPQVVVYKGNALTIAIARMLVKIKFISLVNLIVDKGIVRELIQEDCNALKIAAELSAIANEGTCREQMLADYDTLDARMGQPGASAKTASLIIKYAAKK
jgi:lipid-A-disaccharide synthase